MRSTFSRVVFTQTHNCERNFSLRNINSHYLRSELFYNLHASDFLFWYHKRFARDFLIVTYGQLKHSSLAANFIAPKSVLQPPTRVAKTITTVAQISCVHVGRILRGTEPLNIVVKARSNIGKDIVWHAYIMFHCLGHFV